MNDRQHPETAEAPTGEDAAPRAWGLDLRHAACGLMMGAADIIPGVSGGTVALILGIYARLVTAISHFDSHLVRLLLDQKWQSAWERVDARFLLGLGTGIATGIVGLAKLMRYLLEYHHMQTMAVFFGLILGSSLLVARRIRLPRSMSPGPLWVAGAVAAGVAFWLVGLPLLDLKDETVSLFYVFVCGVIAICAMILPGVSGAYFLVVLGLYYHIIDILHRLMGFAATPRDLATIAVFAIGCACGLIGFSKIVRWLLVRFEVLTMAILCGLMLGSLRKVWPFQIDTSPGAEFQQKVFEPFLPSELSSDVWIAAGLVGAAAASVLILEYVAGRRVLSVPTRGGQSLESPLE